MTWEHRDRLWCGASTSLVLWAALALVAALLCAPVVWWLDRETGWAVFGYSPAGARAVLSTLVVSMLTFIVFVLSVTLIVVQLASGQLTPRVIAPVLAKPGVKIALGTLTFTYAYTLAALLIATVIYSADPGVVVMLLVTTLAGLVVLVAAAHRFARSSPVAPTDSERGGLVPAHEGSFAEEPKR